MVTKKKTISQLLEKYGVNGGTETEIWTSESNILLKDRTHNRITVLILLYYYECNAISFQIVGQSLLLCLSQVSRLTVAASGIWKASEVRKEEICNDLRDALRNDQKIPMMSNFSNCWIML